MWCPEKCKRMGSIGRTGIERRRALASRIFRLRPCALQILGLVLAMAGAKPQSGVAQETKIALPPVLTTTGAIQGLSHAEAAKALPVDVVATVEYYEAKRLRLFVSDPTGGVYVSLASPDELPMERGDLIEVQGVTDASFRTRIAGARIRMLGRKGTLAPPREEGFRELMSGREDCRSVLIRGTIRSANPKPGSAKDMAQLMVQIPGGTVRVYVEDARGLDLEALIDTEVEASGVAGGIFNGRFQLMQTVLYSTDPSQLKVLRAARVRPQDLPYTAIGEVLPTRFLDDQTERVRVQGTVTFYEPAHMVVIQHNGESLLAETHEVKPVALGEVVDVTGFADGNDAGPKLNEAQILRTGRFEKVTPQRVTYDEAIAGKYSDGLVTIGGQVLSQLHNEISDTMVVVVEGHPVNVLLWTGDRPQLPTLPMGTKVQVTGICHVTKTDSWGTPVSFLLEMREPGDVAVAASASWWTVTHLLFLLLGLLLVSLVITGWALVLRRRVSTQAERIRSSMALEQQRSRLLEKINSSTPLPELLEDICGSIGGLLPGLEVKCEVLEAYHHDSKQRKAVRREDQSGAAASAGANASRSKESFKVELTESSGAALGYFRALCQVNRALTEEEQRALRVGASLSNLALNQRRLYERLNFHSTHDPLTGLPNRRYSDMRLEESLRTSGRQGHLVAVVYIDVNHFKQVNDEFGHKTGDLYLQEIAVRLGAQVRAGDVLARIGGDEFMLTAELNRLEEAEIYRQRLRRCFEPVFRLEGVVVHGSASVGLAISPEHGTTAEELQRHADMDMYAAKEARKLEFGRGAVGVAS
jgi:diguanylate cyclase (GGDEF)-like protein